MISLSGEVLAQQGIVLNRVGEFGCGTGCNLLTLRNRGAVVLDRVDLSEGMLAVARRRIPEALFGAGTRGPQCKVKLGVLILCW